MARESSAEIDRIAAEWVARADRDGFTAEERAELDEWLAGDARRAGAYVRAEAAWMLLDRGRALFRPQVAHDTSARTAADCSAQPLQPGPDQPARFEPAEHRVAFRRGKWFMSMALAATLAAVAVAAVWVWSPFMPEQSYSSRVGEIREISLEDGSRVTLSSASEVHVALKHTRRVLRLERGEAWFEVAKDPSRPFLVTVNGVQVRAVGTAFSIRRDREGARVIVTEGAVDAWSDSRDGLDRVRVAARMSLQIEGDHIAAAPAELSPEALQRALSWTQGMIALDGRTLEEAIAEFNRFNARQIVLDVPSLRHEQLVGLFKATDPDGFARAAAAMLQAEVQVTGPEIHLSKVDRR